eukprot:5497067-Amphidinium_carterae.6
MTRTSTLTRSTKKKLSTRAIGVIWKQKDLNWQTWLIRHLTMSVSLFWGGSGDMKLRGPQSTVCEQTSYPTATSACLLLRTTCTVLRVLNTRSAARQGLTLRLCGNIACYICGVIGSPLVDPTCTSVSTLPAFDMTCCIVPSDIVLNKAAHTRRDAIARLLP